MKIIKRDGMLKDFDFKRIQIAITNAYEDVYGKERVELLNKYSDEIEEVLDNVFEEVAVFNDDNIAVEEVQDIVIKALNIVNKDVAKAYQDYREERTRIREYNTDVYKKLDKVLNATDIVNSNANVDEASFGGRKFETAGLIMKKYALDNLIDKDIAKAHRENRGYIHDLDSYAVGMHNCSFPDMRHLLLDGFSTRNGDVRGANSLSTAMQQVAVIFQVQSQDQYGGTGSAHIDYDLEPFVDKSFRKYIKKGCKYLNNSDVEVTEDTTVENIDEVRKLYGDRVVDYALEELDKEGVQSAQGLYHNLNTLESRPGSQVPFTSINFGRRDTEASRMIDKWLLKASLDGIGKFHRTSIFPISIFQYKKGINDKEGTPNYEIKKLAIESMSKRIYPNWVNCDWKNNIEDVNNPDTTMATMG